MPTSTEESVEIDTLRSILRDHVPDETREKILNDILKAKKEELKEKHDEEEVENGEEDSPQKEKKPRIPKKLVAIITGSEKKLTKQEVENFSGFIIELPEETNPKEIPHLLKEVKQDYDLTKKSSKNPAESLGTLWENAPPKLFKEHSLTKKSKSAVEFILIQN